MEPHEFPFADLIFRPPGVLMTGTGFEAVIVLLYSFAPVTRIMGILRPIRDIEARNTWRGFSSNRYGMDYGDGLIHTGNIFAVTLAS